MTDPRISIIAHEPGPGIVHRQVIPFFNGEFLLCPRCGVEASSWAADDRNERFDWWDCICGATGAYMHPNLPGVTQNGVPLIGYSPYVVPESGKKETT